MAKVSQKELIKKMEELKNGERLTLHLSPTFGGGAVIIELNPSQNNNGQKKYLMWWGEDEVKAKASQRPFLSSDKAKKIAAWPAERDAHWAV